MSVLVRTQPKAAVYVAATRQHVGKTSTCLGLLQGLTVRLDRIGFLKPVGQESVAVEGGSLRVDKDVAVAKGRRAILCGLWRLVYIIIIVDCRGVQAGHVQLRGHVPVVIMPGYTKRFLDGHITVESQLTRSAGASTRSRRPMRYCRIGNGGESSRCWANVLLAFSSLWWKAQDTLAWAPLCNATTLG